MAAEALKLKLEARGFRVIVCSTSGSKRARAFPHAGAAKPPERLDHGRCWLLPGDWNDAWAEQHHRFNGRSGNMDLVDATAYGFNEIDVHRLTAWATPTEA